MDNRQMFGKFPSNGSFNQPIQQIPAQQVPGQQVPSQQVQPGQMGFDNQAANFQAIQNAQFRFQQNSQIPLNQPQIGQQSNFGQFPVGMQGQVHYPQAYPQNQMPQMQFGQQQPIQEQQQQHSNRTGSNGSEMPVQTQGSNNSVVEHLRAQGQPHATMNESMQSDTPMQNSNPTLSSNLITEDGNMETENKMQGLGNVIQTDQMDYYRMNKQYNLSQNTLETNHDERLNTDMHNMREYENMPKIVNTAGMMHRHMLLSDKKSQGFHGIGSDASKISQGELKLKENSVDMMRRGLSDATSNNDVVGDQSLPSVNTQNTLQSPRNSSNISTYLMSSPNARRDNNQFKPRHDTQDSEGVGAHGAFNMQAKMVSNTAMLAASHPDYQSINSQNQQNNGMPGLAKNNRLTNIFQQQHHPAAQQHPQTSVYQPPKYGGSPYDQGSNMASMAGQVVRDQRVFNNQLKNRPGGSVTLPQFSNQQQTVQAQTAQGPMLNNFMMGSGSTGGPPMDHNKLMDNQEQIDEGHDASSNSNPMVQNAQSHQQSMPLKPTNDPIDEQIQLMILQQQQQLVNTFHQFNTNNCNPELIQKQIQIQTNLLQQMIQMQQQRKQMAMQSQGSAPGSQDNNMQGVQRLGLQGQQQPSHNITLQGGQYPGQTGTDPHGSIQADSTPAQLIQLSQSISMKLNETINQSKQGSQAQQPGASSGQDGMSQQMDGAQDGTPSSVEKVTSTGGNRADQQQPDGLIQKRLQQLIQEKNQNMKHCLSLQDQIRLQKQKSMPENSTKISDIIRSLTEQQQMEQHAQTADNQSIKSHSTDNNQEMNKDTQSQAHLHAQAMAQAGVPNPEAMASAATSSMAMSQDVRTSNAQIMAASQETNSMVEMASEDDQNVAMSVSESEPQTPKTLGDEEIKSSSEHSSVATIPKQEKKYITIAKRQYILFEGKIIITDKEAENIHEQYYKLRSKQSEVSMEDGKSAFQSQLEKTDGEADVLPVSSAQWKKDETFLLQYIIFSLADQHNYPVEAFSENDWKIVSRLVPGRSSLQCQKRWLFIQNMEGNKNTWTAKETQILKEVAQEFTQRHAAHGAATDKPNKWTAIATEYNKRVDASSQRKPRQCRERWMNAIDPSIKHEKFSPEEEYKVLTLYKQYGTKWHDLAKHIEGRTEIQVKNNFKCQMKRDNLIKRLNMEQDQFVDYLIEHFQAQAK